MPIPYMGSKRKSANKIYSTIHKLNPDGKILVDLFCGGFAIGEKFICKGWDVIANDKNKYVIALLDKVLFEGLPEDVVTKFVTREMFFDIAKNPQRYEPWYVGYVQCVWSFGNNQKDYIFGKTVENIKQAGHELVVNCNSDSIIEIIGKDAVDEVLSHNNINSRRLQLTQCINDIKFELQQLEQLQRLQQLQQLQQLQRLQQLERLQRLQLHSLNYNEVTIPHGSIIYCDPPYAGTAEYKEGSFNHIEFWEWCRKISNTNKIYISEYNAPPDFVPVLKFEQKSTLQGGTQKHNNQPMECLFAPIFQDNTNFKYYTKQSLF